MKKPYDYGYDFSFPDGYDPGNSKKAKDYYFCKETFDNYVTTIQCCVFHVKGDLSGTNLILEKWQLDIVAAIFCLLHKKTGRRRYREAFIYVPRKNGKSLLCSGFVISYLVLDDEMGKQVVSAATNEDQASLIYYPVRMSLKNPENPLNSIDNQDPSLRFNVRSYPRHPRSGDRRRSPRRRTGTLRAAYHTGVRRPGVAPGPRWPVPYPHPRSPGG